MRYLRLDERLQLSGEMLLVMHSRAATAIEGLASLSREPSQHDAISDRHARDEDEIDALFSSSRVVSTLEDTRRGYRSARARSAEIVVHRRAMQYAKYHDRKKSDRESLTERVSTILSMSPALRPMKESA
jgi:hypothetical protein